MAKSIKKPATTASRHATDPSSIPVSDIPPGGEVIVIPRDPCLAAASLMEEMLSAQCKQKYNTMALGCCCKLKEEDRKLIQIHSNTDVQKLNTASNGNIGTLPGGSLQSNWQFSASYPSPPPIGNYAFVISSTPRPFVWGGPPPNADWISEIPSGTPGPNRSTYFRIRFVLCDNIDPNNFALTLNYFVDDQLGLAPGNDEIWVNGVAQSGIPPGFYNGASTQIILSKNWRTCVNEIVFHVRNTDNVPPSSNFLGLLVQFSTQSIPIQQPCGKCECHPAKLPVLKPSFCVTWGDSDCDCFETDDCEVVCITACNCYSNITFEDLTLGPITVLDEFGNPVPLLPDGTPSVMAIPYGPVCFGDLGPCKPNQQSCKSRQIAIKTCGAKPGKYQLSFGTVCYKVCYNQSTEACFEFVLCKD